jgi:hypothetical protein
MLTQTEDRFLERGLCLEETLVLTKFHLQCKVMYKTARHFRFNKISKTSSFHLELSRMECLIWEEVVQGSLNSILLPISRNSMHKSHQIRHYLCLVINGHSLLIIQLMEVCLRQPRLIWAVLR